MKKDTLPIPKQALKMFYSGFEKYSSMIQRLMEITKPPLQTSSEAELNARQEALLRNFRELFELLSPYIKAYKDNEAVTESFESWQHFMKSAPSASLPMPQFCQELKSLADNWQVGTQKLFNDWNECLQELAGSYQESLSKGEDPRQLWINSMASYEKFYNALIEARFSFVTEHMKALFKILQSFLPEEIPTGKAVQEKTGKDASEKSRKTNRKEKAS